MVTTQETIMAQDQERSGPGIGAAVAAFVVFALIAAGAVIVGKRQGGAASGRWSASQVRESADGTRVTMAAVMRETNHSSATRTFRRGDLVAIAGRGRLDLTRATMDGDRGRLDAVVIGGRAELRVPPDWQVVDDGLIIGGFKNGAKTAQGEARHTLRLDVVVLGGTLEISH